MYNILGADTKLNSLTLTFTAVTLYNNCQE